MARICSPLERVPTLGGLLEPRKGAPFAVPFLWEGGWGFALAAPWAVHRSHVLPACAAHVSLLSPPAPFAVQLAAPEASIVGQSGQSRSGARLPVQTPLPVSTGQRDVPSTVAQIVRPGRWAGEAASDFGRANSTPSVSAPPVGRVGRAAALRPASSVVNDAPVAAAESVVVSPRGSSAPAPAWAARSLGTGPSPLRAASPVSFGGVGQSGDVTSAPAPVRRAGAPPPFPRPAQSAVAGPPGTAAPQTGLSAVGTSGVVGGATRLRGRGWKGMPLLALGACGDRPTWDQRKRIECVSCAFPD